MLHLVNFYLWQRISNAFPRQGPMENVARCRIAVRFEGGPTGSNKPQSPYILEVTSQIGIGKDRGVERGYFPKIPHSYLRLTSVRLRLPRRSDIAALQSKGPYEKTCFCCRRACGNCLLGKCLCFISGLRQGAAGVEWRGQGLLLPQACSSLPSPLRPLRRPLCRAAMWLWVWNCILGTQRQLWLRLVLALLG